MTPVNPSEAQLQVKSYVDMHYTDSNPIFSVTIDANMLRDFLNCTAPNAKGQCGTDVTNLKLIFAHEVSYCKSILDNTLVPGAAEQLTFVLAGFDDNGTYILDQNNMVYDRIAPCPSICPPVGQAACTYLQLNAADPCNP